MSADWYVIFFETLAEYAQLYIEACGDPAARAQILKDCQDVITKSPLLKNQAIELPQLLYWVSLSIHGVTCLCTYY